MYFFNVRNSIGKFDAGDLKVTNISSAVQDERRRFFRIADLVHLSFKVVDEEISHKKSHVSNDILSTCSLSTALEMITHESRTLWRRIEYREPEVADYLSVLDTKIDLVAQALLLSMGADTKKPQNHEVNLSASGLAFDCDEALANGSFLEIKMVLSSFTAVLVLYGKVVYCKENTETESYALPYVIGIDYVNLLEEDREILIKHIFKRQMQQIRDSKE